MRKKIFLPFVLGIVFGIGCSEEDIKVFHGERQVFFENFYMNALSPGTEEADTTRTSFFLVGENENEMRVELVVLLSGDVPEQDLTFGLRAVPEGTTAEAEEYDGADDDDESEEDEADRVGAAGGGLNGLVAGQEAETVHFPDGDTFIHEFRVGGSQAAGHADLIPHRIAERSCQFLLKSGYLLFPCRGVNGGRISVGRIAAQPAHLCGYGSKASAAGIICLSERE